MEDMSTNIENLFLFLACAVSLDWHWQDVLKDKE